MKKYIKPVMEGELFVANEFISSCSDLVGGVKYDFECDAGGGIDGDLTSADGKTIYTDSQKHTELGDSTYSSYSACKTTHSASASDEFVLGRFYPNGGNNDLSGSYQTVYIWFEYEGKTSIPFLGTFENYDIHATANPKKETWGKNHS